MASLKIKNLDKIKELIDALVTSEKLTKNEGKLIKEIFKNTLDFIQKRAGDISNLLSTIELLTDNAKVLAGHTKTSKGLISQSKTSALTSCQMGLIELGLEAEEVAPIIAVFAEELDKIEID